MYLNQHDALDSFRLVLGDFWEGFFVSECKIFTNGLGAEDLLCGCEQGTLLRQDRRITLEHHTYFSIFLLLLLLMHGHEGSFH